MLIYMKKYKIAVLPGDGIGPEVTNAAVKVMDAAAELYGVTLDYREVMMGGIAYESAGNPLPDITIESCRMADAALMGTAGGSQWDSLPRKLRPEYAIIGLRRALGLYMNLRPCYVHPSLVRRSPLRADLCQGLDCLLIRELAGVNSYNRRARPEGGNPQMPDAYDVLFYTEDQVRRIAVGAFEIARARRKHLTSVDKVNVLASSRVWRDVFREVARSFPDVRVEYLYADTIVMRLMTQPGSFDVIVADNLFGDFLSEQLGAIQGSPAMAPSASLGAAGTTGLFGGIHGSAENLAGQDICNPLAMIQGASMLMRWGLNEAGVAWSIEHAVDETLRQGYRTADLIESSDDKSRYQLVGTSGMTAAVISNLRRL